MSGWQGPARWEASGQLGLMVRGDGRSGPKEWTGKCEVCDKLFIVGEFPGWSVKTSCKSESFWVVTCKECEPVARALE